MARNGMVKTKVEGVYERVNHSKPLFKKKPDVAFYITYKKGGRKVWERVGYLSKGASLKLALQVRRERLHSILHGETLPKEKAKIPKFSEMAELYLKWAKENKSRDIDDKGRYENHLKNPLGAKRLNEITPFDLEKLKSNLVKKELAPATVRHCLYLVREIFNKAKEWRRFQGEHPLKGVKLPTLQNRRERFLSHEEADLLLKELAEINGKATHDQALLSLHCGLRAGEVFNLRGQDLDFENGVIRIMDSKKTANRTAYMTQAVREMLRARLPKDPGDLIFKERGTGDRIKIVSQSFDRAIEKLGLNKDVVDRRQKVVFHTLRHTFASSLAIEGVPLLTIANLMGHKTLTMTQRYAHLSPSAERAASITLERAFNQSRDRKVIPLAAAQQVPADR